MQKPDPEIKRANRVKKYAFSISDSHRFIYIRTAKVATQSIVAAFRSREDIDLGFAQMRPYPRGPRRDYFAFAFTRNPYTRLVSCWKDKVVGGGNWSLKRLKDIEFEEFVTELEKIDISTTDRHARPQFDLIPSERISFLGRLESLDTDWDRLCEMLGIDDLPLAHTHKSPAPDAAASPVIDPALAERIIRLYEMDFRLFGYPMDVPESLR